MGIPCSVAPELATLQSGLLVDHPAENRSTPQNRTIDFSDHTLCSTCRITTVMSAFWRNGAAANPYCSLLCVKTTTQPVPFRLKFVKQMLLSGEVPAAIAALICTMVKM